MKHTTNYNLNKIELTDSPPDITALNPNFDTIDAQLKSLVDKDAEIVASINTVKNDYLPKTGGNITNALKVKNKTVAVSVNGSVADANGNIVLDVGGDVKSINSVRPDENGNVELDLGGDVASVDGVKPDAEGNVALNASTREEILEGAMRVTDVEVEASIATHEALQTAVARVEANLDSKLPLSGGTMTGDISASHNAFKINKTSNTGYTATYGGTDHNNGGYVSVYGKDHTTEAGQVRLGANNGSSKSTLVAYPDGKLQWNSREVERVNSRGTNYIRFESGLQMCWGYATIPSGDSAVNVTYPVAFSSVPATFCTDLAEEWYKPTNIYLVYLRSGTSCRISTSSSNGNTFYYFAIGYWK